MARPLPSNYEWLNREQGPKMLVEALRHYGELEVAGSGNNVNIMRWAKEVGVSGWYTQDSIPWCGLFIGVVAKRAGYPFSAAKLLAAREWLNWGQPVEKGQEKLGDILVFSRNGGGHVGIYIGESPKAFLVYGGNQSDSVTFSWILKSRCIGTRRPIYKIGQPQNVRKIFLNDNGTFSNNEA